MYFPTKGDIFMSLDEARKLLEDDAKNNIKFLIRVRDSEENCSTADRVRAAVTLARMNQSENQDPVAETEDIGQIIVRMSRERGIPI